MVGARVVRLEFFDLEWKQNLDDVSIIHIVVWTCGGIYGSRWSLRQSSHALYYAYFAQTW